MSKITEYQERVRIKEASDDRQSVGEFALELKKPPEILLAQLKEAGVPKLRVSDDLTHEDKAALCRYLEKQNEAPRRRKKITVTIESQEQKLIRRVAKQENGAEFEALRQFAGNVVFGNPIDPMFQKLVNLITAKAVLIGALPLEKLGRPKREELDSIGFLAAQRYWDMIDSGIGYQSVVEKLSSEYHKSERHIMRLIAKHKKSVGETLEERSRKRRWNEVMSDVYSKNPGAFEHYKALFEPKVPFPELSLDDYLCHLEELTVELANSVKPLTKKI